MNYTEFCSELNLAGGFLSIKRMMCNDVSSFSEKGCTLRLLAKAFDGDTIYFSKDNMACPGASTGFGFTDGLPKIPGGFGYFISHGRGEGFPPGEHVKCSPEIGERMLLSQPQGVLEGFDCICIKPYEQGVSADTVTSLVTPDQLSALIHLFCFRKSGFDNVIMPMVSGCSSVFRIPFGELKKEEPRGVVGNVDVFSRSHFAENTFFFTVPGKDFETMIADADNSVLSAKIWSGVKSRLDFTEN